MSRRPHQKKRTMPEAGVTVAVVSDHAVLRFIERQHGVDIEAIRATIREICAPGVRLGAAEVVSGKGKFVLEDGRVVTFLKGYMRAREQCPSRDT